MFNWAGRNAGPFILIIMIIDTKFDIGDKVYTLVDNKIHHLYIKSSLISGGASIGFPKSFIGIITFKLHHKSDCTFQDMDEWIDRRNDECFKTKEDLLKSL